MTILIKIISTLGYIATIPMILVLGIYHIWTFKPVAQDFFQTADKRQNENSLVQ